MWQQVVPQSTKRVRFLKELRSLTAPLVKELDASEQRRIISLSGIATTSTSRETFCSFQRSFGQAESLSQALDFLIGRHNQETKRLLGACDRNRWSQLLLIFGGATFLQQSANADSAKEDLNDIRVEGIRPAGEVKTNSHTARWRVYTDKGRDFFLQGKWEEAEKYLNQALEQAKLGFGEQDQHVASSYQNLAELYRIRGNFAEAEPLYLKAIAQLEETVGPDDFTVGQAMHNLAGCYLVQRKYDEARRYYEKALEIKGTSKSTAHPEYANTQFHLGEVLRLQGHDKEAISLMRASIKIMEEGGAGHTPSAVSKMGRLAQLLVQSGDLKGAEMLQRKVLHATEMEQGPKAANVAQALENLGLTLLAQHRFEDASEALQSALQIRWDSDQSNPAIGRTLYKLAMVSENAAVSEEQKEGDQQKVLENYQAAAELLERAVKIEEQTWEKAGSSLQAAMRAKAVAESKGRGLLEAEAQLHKATQAMFPRLQSLVNALHAFGRVNLKLATFEAQISPEDRRRMELTGEASVRQALEILTEHGPQIPGLEKALEDSAVQQQVCQLLLILIRLLHRKWKRVEDTRMIEEELARLTKKADEVEARLPNEIREQLRGASEKPPDSSKGWRGWIKLRL